MNTTLVVILNHNLPVFTDFLYESLKPYEQNHYELVVFDNGSSPGGVSKYTTYRSETNGFFGGGFEAARQIVLSDLKYDSLLFLNNDLTVYGMNFVSALRTAMFRIEYPPINCDVSCVGTVIQNDVVSPCFFNIEPDKQCHWRTMWNWCKKEPRVVPFIDMQGPLMSRRLLEAMGPTDPLLRYGWSIDFWMALTCERNGWKMSVMDNVSMLHHNSMTVKSGAAGIDVPTYCRLAEEGQRQFIKKMGIESDFHRIRSLGENYKA